MKLTKANEPRGEIEALRERLAKLSEASLRVSESLDVSTVLREVVDSARELTGALYGGITTLDESGQFQDFVTSGLTPEERQRLLDMPDGLPLYEYLRDFPGPLRLRDLGAHAKSIGGPGELQLNAFLGTPILHRGVHVGNFYLANEEVGREFTDEDEEVLELFAAQAATAIANARRHRDEQRARADLEALIDTSPVGVVVFDARSGEVASVNREAKRIVSDLWEPGQSAQHILEALTIRRADGREISLEESPLARALSEAATVRAEEIILQTPDGRKLTTLVNATPIRAESGKVESVIVTLQDMTPLEELERLRAEFLGMVSHELRAPLASIKGSATTMLGALSALDPAEMLQFLRIIDEQADHMRQLISDLLDAGRIETGTLSVSPEPAEVAAMVEQARKTFVSGGGANPIRVDLPPELPRVLADRRRIVQVLGNLLSNAARYSPASSDIRVAVAREGVHVAVSVADEGRGVPADLLPHLFRKFSRAGGEGGGRGLSGSGLGLAISKGLVEAHGGRIWAESAGAGLGTRFTFTIPAVEEVGNGDATSRARTPGRRRRADPGRTRVLVVDDDPQALLYVRDTLQQAGYEPLGTGEPEEVPGLIKTRQPDLVLLDLLLPGTDGIELMQRVPALAERPVIFLSAYGRDETIARALEAGAADYIVKPFSPTELVARIQAALRKRNAPRPLYQMGELAIDYEERRVSLAGRPVQLTATEYNLLRELSVKAGRVLAYEDLLRRVWGPKDASDVRLVRAVVKNLRRKLGDDASRPTYILNEHGVGYRMPKPMR